MLAKRTCKKCEKTKDIGDFNINYANPNSGVLYRKYTCADCDKVARRTRAYNRKPLSDEAAQKLRNACKRYHRDPKKRAGHIVRYARRSDRLRGHTHSIGVEWVKEQIAKGCSYCGETELVMTMDRIDNSLGHTQENTVPACIRCNYLRRDMPIAAWRMIVPAIRETRMAGMFGSWDCFGRMK